MIAAFAIIAFIAGGILLMRLWLLHEDWKEAIAYGSKFGLSPRHGESLEEFQYRVRRAAGPNPEVSFLALSEAMNRLAPTGAVVYVKSEPGKVVFKIAGKTLTDEQRARLRHEAELLTPKNLEIEIVNRGRSS